MKFLVTMFSPFYWQFWVIAYTYTVAILHLKVTEYMYNYQNTCTVYYSLTFWWKWLEETATVFGRQHAFKSEGIFARYIEICIINVEL